MGRTLTTAPIELKTRTIENVTNLPAPTLTFEGVRILGDFGCSWFAAMRHRVPTFVPHELRMTAHPEPLNGMRCDGVKGLLDVSVKQ